IQGHCEDPPVGGDEAISSVKSDFEEKVAPHLGGWGVKSLLFQFKLLHKLINNLSKIRIANLLEIIINPGIGFLDFDDPVQIDRGSYNYTVAICIVNGCFKVFQLLISITHRRKKRSYIRIQPECFAKSSHSIWSRINEFCSSEFTGCNNSGSNLHLSMGKSWAIFDNKHSFPFYQR